MLADVNTALAKVHAKGLPQAQQLPSSITPEQQKKFDAMGEGRGGEGRSRGEGKARGEGKRKKEK